MIAVRPARCASTFACFAIAVVASLGVRSNSDRPSSIIVEPRPPIDIDEPACDGVHYELVPYIETPPTDPPRTREEAIERATPHGILGIEVARPCRPDEDAR
jgi:hypothetical protein